MPLRILVVDDNVDNLEVMSTSLEHVGYEVLRAKDGIEAYNSALNELPDLILLDLSLPLKSGWEVAAELREQPQTSHIPIIAFSAHVLESDREEAFKAGCNTFLTKPLRPRDVIREIQALLGES